MKSDFYQAPKGKRDSFLLLMYTVAGVLTLLSVSLLYYFNTSTHLTP